VGVRRNHEVPNTARKGARQEKKKKKIVWGEEAKRRKKKRGAPKLTVSLLSGNRNQNVFSYEKKRLPYWGRGRVVGEILPSGG